MRDTYSPPLWAVLGCLANIILSVAMIWYLIIFLSSCGSCEARPFTYIFFIGFGVILALTLFELFKLLFSPRKRSIKVRSLVRGIIEIDAKVK